MRLHQIITLLAIVLIAGCAAPREDQVPGNVAPGSIEEVSNRASGSDVGAGIQGLSVVPVTGSAPKQIPIIRSPEIITFYVFPRESRDGMAYRHGCYISAVKRPFSWGEAEVMKNNRLRLSSLTNLRLDDNGQLVVDLANSIEPAPEAVQGIRDIGGRMPWRAGDKKEQTTTTVIYPDGKAVSTVQPTEQTPNYVDGGSVSMQEVERAINDANKRLQQAQKAPAANQPSQRSPGATR